MNSNWFGVFKNRIAVHNFNFCPILVNSVTFKLIFENF